MQTIAISKFKARCLAILEEVRRTGEPVRVTRFGMPVAEIVPPKPSAEETQWMGRSRGELRIVGDIVSPGDPARGLGGPARRPGRSMRLLLDTHVWIWSLVEPERLSRETRSALSDPEAELYLSPISVWELLLLHERGRIELDQDPEQWVASTLAKTPLREAPLTWKISSRSRGLQIETEDPADRFLAATAAERNLTLVTSDRRLACVRRDRDSASVIARATWLASTM